MLTFGSVCSGIEAAQLAFAPIGFKQLWSSEIAEFPSQVLEHHYPQIKNWGDMLLLPKLITEEKVEAPDMLCGGTPCQAFSLAGWKNGLEDERGQLTLTFIKIANAIDAVRLAKGLKRSLILWENVEGVLNDKTNAFGNFISALAGYDTALTIPKWTKAGYIEGVDRNVVWRVLDAKTFGLAQQRKRLYVIASDKSINPVEILFELGQVKPKINSNCLKSLPLFANSVNESSSKGIRIYRDNIVLEVFREYTDCLYSAYGTKWNGNAAAYNGSLYVSQNNKLRRLTPGECERLMGIPDGYTDIPSASLTSRYQAIGNSWAVPVINWIGKRVAKIVNISSKNIKLDLEKVLSPSHNNLNIPLYLLGNIYPTLNGEFLNTTESKSNPVSANIFDFLTVENIPQNLYLSPKACAGILRRKTERKLKMNNRLEEIMSNIALGIK